jgi:RNA polymerase sigma-70 factor (ECF subfamily)
MHPATPVRQRGHQLSSSNSSNASFRSPIEDSGLRSGYDNSNVSAFTDLAKKHRHKLLRVAQSVTRNREDAEDAAQEALLKAFQKLDQFRGKSKFSTWLFRININESLMKLRERPRMTAPVSRRPGMQIPAACREISDPAPTPEERCYASELSAIIARASKKLRPSLMSVFVLRDIEGLSINQTAGTLQITESAVKSRLARARGQLRDQLCQINLQYRHDLRLRLGNATLPEDGLVQDNRYVANHNGKCSRRTKTTSAHVCSTEPAVLRAPVSGAYGFSTIESYLW